MVVELDLTDPEHVRDPYPVLDRLRAEDPVHRSRTLDGWVLSRYADVRTAVRAPELSVDTLSPFLAARGRTDPDAAQVAAFARLWAVFTDPPDHTRLRSALNRGFGARQVSTLEPMVADLVELLLDRVAPKGQADLVAGFAFPLPAMVIARVLGVPEDDMYQVRDWSEDIGQFVATSPDPDRYRRARAAMEEMADYLRALIRARPDDREDDLLGGLVAARRAGTFRTDDELVSNCILLLFAGHETTANLIANGTYHLLRHPEQLRRLRERPELATPAVEELLRYDGPVHAVTRVVAADTELGGRRLRAGERVFAFLTGANRDPAVFPQPERLDVARHPNPVLSFGYGIHFCLGAPLARLEARIAFPALLRRLPDLRLDGPEPRWKPLLVLRSMESLPVAFTPA